jgi:uncharacterized membrane protein (UPF0127 family)
MATADALINSSAMLMARNLDTGEVIADRITVATTRVERGVGLLKHDRLAPGAGLLITPCRGVHTCFMRFTIDVIALDASGVVVDAVEALVPWRVRLPRRGSVSVLELSEGSLARTNIERGHRIELEPVRAVSSAGPAEASAAVGALADTLEAR